MRVQELMSEPAITVNESATLEEAARLMMERELGGLPVVNEKGELIGMITRSDFVSHEEAVPFSLFRAPQLFGRWVGPAGIARMYEQARTFPVREIMSRSLVTISPTASIDRAIRLLMKSGKQRLIVVRGKKPVGVIARQDLLRIMLHTSKRILSEKGAAKSRKAS